MTDNLLQRQLDLETECSLLGSLKYQQNLENLKPEGSRVHHSWINKHIKSLSEYITLKMQALEEGDHRKRMFHVGYQSTKDLEPEVLAHHTLRFLIQPSVLEDTKSLTSNAISLSRILTDELNYRKLADKQFDKYRAEQKVIKDHMRQKFTPKQLLMNAGVVPLEWDTKQKVMTGAWLIDMAIDLLGLWELKMFSKGPKQQKALVAKQPLLDWFEQAHNYVSTLSPLKKPMVHPPLDWSNSRDGGYVTDVFSKDYLVRSFDRDYVDSLNSVDLTRFYKALNGAQSTPFKINKEVLEIAQWCWEESIQLGNNGKEVLPTKKEMEIPSYPSHWNMTPKEMRQEHPLEHKKYATRIARAFRKNKSMVSKRIASNTTLSLAEEFKNEEAIYFPHNADFRGRIYPIPNFLNPQGTDLSKGILQFAKGMPLGDDGAYWLHVHAANCWGVDKVSNAERVAWTERKMQAILDSALNPKDGACFWMEADKPLSALAVAFELLKYQAQGDEMVSYLPIPMDGSCNGLQNFSAMLRDPVGAKATNLTPSDVPNDIYQDVADLVVKKVDADALKGNVLALTWQGHINRSTVKQPVMTLPYGATQNGMRDQLLDWLRKNKPDLFAGNKTWEACGYLSLLTYKAINEVVVAARSAMDYLKKVSAVVSKSGLPLSWVTPVGFPVLQHYKKFKRKRLEVHIQGKRTNINIQTDDATLDKRRQGMGISPNFIHSSDSSHLMLTILLSLENDITDFAMVHDSYATHACNTSLLQACIRDSFVNMYTPDVLKRFHEEIKAQLEDRFKDKLPELPEMGDFNLDLVRDSEYFFA